jgi:FAD/FMN-containing dehydrogenase
MRSKSTLNRCAFPGAKVPPPDPRYPTLVRGFNQRFVGTPQYVQLCGDVKQVRQAVQEALKKGLRITVRGGGHCYENFVSGNHGGLIIDLSPLNAVCRAAGDESLFYIEGGCTLWDVYSQLYKEYGVTIPGGSCSTVGAGGHIMGGGYGLLSRKYGLTVDHLDKIELVRVNEAREVEVITVSRDSQDKDEQDIFWAHLGGGGGNFGIVTKYWFKEPPAAPSWAYVTSIAWDWDKITPRRFAELVNNYGNFFAQHSEIDSPYKELFALLHLTQKAATQIVLTIQYVGDHPALIDSFIDAIRPQRVAHVPQRVPVGFHHLVVQTAQTRKMPWLEATQTLDGTGPNQRGKYKSAYMIEPFPDAQIKVMWEYLTDPDYRNPQALLQVDSYGCEINRIARAATAIPQRSSIMKLQYQTYWTEPEDDEVNLSWIRNFYTAMYGPQGPYPDGTVDGCYVNYPDSDLVNWQYLYYKENYPRLQQAKAKSDPLNIFNHQQSIQLPRDDHH